jgi:hypothetical protein
VVVLLLHASKCIGKASHRTWQLGKKTPRTSVIVSLRLLLGDKQSFKGEGMSILTDDSWQARIGQEGYHFDHGA